MANLMVVSCPQCNKQMKAPEELRGKKVRCKGCGHTFALGGAEPAPAAKPAAKPATVGDEESYGVSQDESLTVPRCPHCAQEMTDEDAVICIHCGYNTVTRQRVGTKKVVETTAGEHFHWLLPGIGSVAGILALIGFDLFFCFWYPKIVNPYGDWAWLDSNGIRLWTVIISGFMMFFLGKFAFGRLILHSSPPERETDI